MTSTTKHLRCAIYTRKSSEEGLEQDFNSLHAQREACEAYIKSQRHEGWQLIKAAYDDGGISGGTMQRPALQRLLEDIKAKKVDIIVVYKVDRLTRSLADFARMVELFDSHGVSFVSVTQQFNTTSSMGRLTLNVLLSFAQFEREVTGERIRDKIKASKAKGIFMGGRVPLGYRVQDRKLLIREDEAATVRHMFRRYLELGCVSELKKELEQQGFRSRFTSAEESVSTTSTTGPAPSVPSSAPFLSRGAIYQILRNPAYIGQVRHKGVCHPGQHQPIIDQPLWHQVQQALDDKRTKPKVRTRVTEASALIGKLVDEAGEGLTPTHTIKRGRRYRYYISRRLTTTPGDTGWRLPAKPFEDAVVHSARQGLNDSVAVSLALQSAGIPAPSFAATIASIKQTAAKLSDLDVLGHIIQSVQLRSGGLALKLNLAALMNSPQANDISGPKVTMTYSVPMEMKRRGVEMRLVLRSGSEQPANIDPVLVKTIARAHAWFDDLLIGKITNLNELVEREGVSKGYISDIIKLAFLSPAMVNDIVTGRQPANLATDHLIKCIDLPISWQAQQQHFSFS